MKVVLAMIAGAAALFGATARPAAPGGDRVPAVTIVGDSVMTGVLWHPEAVSIVQEGLATTWDVAVCRAAAGISCPYEGSRPPTLLDVADERGSELGRTVVVECGYNDPAAAFAADVEASIDALVDVGVTNILWVNLHEATPALAAMNRTLEQAASVHPELTLVDWNAWSAGHPDWFQTDGIHLTTAGGIALATLLHTAIWTSLSPPLVTHPATLPAATVGRPYRASVNATGGRAPYSWRSVSGPLPRGLHLRPDGSIDGTPRRAGRATLTLAVTDSDGVVARERVTVSVSR